MFGFGRWERVLTPYGGETTRPNLGDENVRAFGSLYKTTVYLIDNRLLILNYTQTLANPLPQLFQNVVSLTNQTPHDTNRTPVEPRHRKVDTLPAIHLVFSLLLRQRQEPYY